MNPVCESVETAQGVPLTVTGVAQVKIMKNPDLLQTASEQFLGKKEHEIKSTVLQTLEGHLRAILGKPFISILFFFFLFFFYSFCLEVSTHCIHPRQGDDDDDDEDEDDDDEDDPWR